MSILELNSETSDGVVRVALVGELDIGSAPALESELDRVERDRPAMIALDLRRLEFLDSTGLRVLLEADARGKEMGRRVVIVRGPSAVQRVLAITRLDERLDLVDAPPSSA
ncbi:MAG: STAS domain-containing protein [Solirubrobacteraceae bacterium]|nr:MAG: anti-anti-sigma factor [Solirubrobacterales bacterium]